MTPPQTPPEEPLSLAPYKPGEDDLWDRLGSDWQRVDTLPGSPLPRNIYVRWSNEESGRRVLTGLCVSGPSVAAEQVRAIPFARLQGSANLSNLGEQHPSKLPPLRRTRGEDPEAFAEQVALYYRWFAAFGTNPAQRLAAHSGVPVGTVHGWVREARMRGKLPPGRQGRAG